MPEVKVVYWNVESYGDNNNRRGNYAALSSFIAQVMVNVDADILCLMEFRGNNAAGRNRIDVLLRALDNAFNAAARVCDWMVDWVPGGLNHNGGQMVAFDPNVVGFSGNGRLEGYAVFWKQNLAKFSMKRADPIDLQDANPPNFPPVGAGTVASTQSNGVRAMDVTPVGAAVVSATGGDIDVPGGANPFALPVGSTIPAAGIVDNMGMAVVGGGAGVLGAALNLNPGDVLPVGTIVGAGGLELNQALLGQNPILVPANFTLTNALTLPAANSTFLPEHVMNLVLTGRHIGNGGNINNYNPGAGPPANAWELLTIPSTNGALLWNGGRRPAFFTIELNNAQNLNNRLVPITILHTPLAGAADGMERCAISRQAFEAYDHGGGNYIRNSRALMGGDLNVRLEAGAQEYQRFTAALGGPMGQNGGAAFSNGLVPGIRVNEAAPGAAPAFPPTAMPLTSADNPENKTTVQINHPVIGNAMNPSRPVLSNVSDHFKRLAIDNIFFRGFTAIQAPRQTFLASPGGGAQQTFDADVYDLLLAISDAVPAAAVAAGVGAGNDNFFIPAAILQAFQNIPIWPGGGFGMGTGYGTAGFNNIENPAQLLADLALGVFQPVGGLFGPPLALGPAYNGPGGFVAVNAERRAAEFIKLFVSDHLPVIFTMNV